MSHLNRSVILAIAYFASGWLGLKMPSVGTHITLVWLPTGIAVAALFRWGWGVWPGVFLGAWLVNFSIGSSFLLAAGIAVGNTLGPVFAVAWLKRAGFQQTFTRQKDVAIFIVAAFLGMMVSASGGVASLYFAGLMPLAAAGAGWLTWWMGDSVGVLLAAPILLSISRNNIEQLSHYRREMLLWVFIAALTAWLAFVLDHGHLGRGLPLAFLTLPLLAWAALRFGITGASLAGLGFSVVAAWGTALGHGTFHILDVHTNLFLLWSYMATTVLTGLLITALQAERRQVENALQESEKKLRGLYELSPLGIALTGMQGRYVEFNEAFRNICGYPEDELKAIDYWTLTPKKYEADEARQLESLNLTGRYGPYEKEYIRRDGVLVPLRLNGMLIRGSDGQDYIWSIVEDITESKKIEADLRIAATAFEAQIGIIVTNAEGIILRVNRAFSVETGYQAEEAIGQTPRMLRSGRHGDEFYAAMWDSLHRSGVWQGEIWDRRKSGEVYPKWMTITAVKDDNGTTVNYVSTQVDITESKAAAEEIKNLAFFDPLTQLPNRRLFQDRLQQARVASVRSGRYGALMILDMDHFKTINDTLGHAMGDQVLIEVARRLNKTVREGDTIARLGGGEFVVLLEGLSHQREEAATQAELAAEKIRVILGQTYSLNEHEYHSTPSIGISLFLAHQENETDLLRYADVALYQAKAAGRNAIRFYDPVMQSILEKRTSMEADLRHALEKQQLRLFYQVQVDSLCRPVGTEVLLRWEHPERGMVLPDQFIPLAEDTGLIVPIGAWVLETACAQLKTWQDDAQTSDLTLSVNVSGRQFRQPDFVAQVQRTLVESGAKPRLLKLELTESVVLENVEDAIMKMQALKSLGLEFSMDDFGTGHSSLSYLKRLPLDQIKIDRSFVRDIATDSNDAVIVNTIIAMSQTLGLSVIAEGVETDAQREFLGSHGCHVFQGYLYSKPVPLDQFEAWVKNPARG
ncbi:MAG: EAL domain-containing protein [Sulfuricella denitrificans]|nr:EAL domain-containing protein [Sulfuricella denitrificans]